MQERQNYRKLYNSMLNAFDALNVIYFTMEVVYDKDGKPIDLTFKDVNPVTERLMGKDRKDIIGKTRKQVFGDVIDDLPPKLDAVLKTGQPAHFQTIGSGLKRYYDVYAWKMNNKAVEGFLIDLTEQKRAEESLRKLNRHLRAISNSNQALMHASDEETFAQEVCNIVVGDCGYALVWVGFAENDKEKTVRPVAYCGFDKSYIDALNVSWDDKSERGRGPTGTVIRTGEPYVCNMGSDRNFKPWKKKAEERGYTASLVLPLKSFEGKTFGALNIYSQESNPFSDEEVTLLLELASDFAYGIVMLRLRKERAQAEDTLKKQASLIDLSPDAIIVKKLDDTITFWSQGAQRLYGWTKEEALGKKTILLFKTTYPDQPQKILEQLKSTGYWSGEKVHLTKLGNKVIVASRWLTSCNNSGQIEEILETNVDITERKKAEEALRERTEQLEMTQSKLEENAAQLEEYAIRMEELAQDRLNKLKDSERLAAIGATAGMVGHDIRNPLQAISGDVYLAKTDLASLPDSEEKNSALESMREIEKNVDYINKIVQDLQDYARPLNPKQEESDLKQLIGELVTKNHFPQNIKISVKVPNSIRKIKADSYYLNRILYNLVTNAVQAMPNGGQLTIRAHEEANNKLITVEDTGVGIPKNIQQKMFTLMFTTKSKGQGFGLPVVKRMTESLGGTVTFESQEGKGTKFIVRLPSKRN